MSSEVSDMIKNLKKEDIVKDKAKPFSVTKQLEDALKIIEPTDLIKTTDQRLAFNVIISAIHAAHMSCLQRYKIDDVLQAIADVQHKISNMSFHIISKRSHIPLIGIMAGDTLLPITFHSQTEAKRYIISISATLEDFAAEKLNVVQVELNASVIDNIPDKPDTIDSILNVQKETDAEKIYRNNKSKKRKKK